MNPQNAIEWNKKSYEYEKQGNLSEALRCIDEAVKIQPRSEVYLLHKATVLEKTERFQEALEIYHHVMNVIPQSTKGYIGIVRCLNKLGKNDEIEAYDEEIMRRLKPETSPFTGDFKIGGKNLTEEQKEELRKTLGFSDRELGGMMDYLSEYEQKQNENAEKAKILLGEDYVKNLLEENPNAMQSYHFSEPYNSMSLEELKHLRNIDQKEETISEKDTLALKKVFGESLYNYLENQGAAFTCKALEKRLESFIEDPNERKYGRENLEETLNKLRAHGHINSSVHNGVTHYFVPKQPPIPTNQTSSSLREPSKLLRKIKSETEMSSLYQAAGFIAQGKLKMIQKPGVNFVYINITTNGFEFIGTLGNFTQFMKDSTGYSSNISWSDIKSIKKTKERLMHVIIIETYNTFYTILPIDTKTSGRELGISSSKRNANDLIVLINKAKALKSTFCTNCGEQTTIDSDFCGNCGHKFS